MKSLLAGIQWLARSTVQTTVGNIVLASLVIFTLGVTHAAQTTSYDVTNEPQMNLDGSIDATRTTGIVLSAPQLNAADHTFATTSGGVLRIRWGFYKEDISYTSATVNATTKRVTLVGVTRDICTQYTRTFVSCNGGRAWGKGAIVELIQDARLFNLKANVDRANMYTAAQSFNGSGSLTVPVFASLDAANRQIGSPVNGMIFYNTGSGALFQRVSNAWTTIGSATTVNATLTAAGKVQIGSSSALAALTATGSTGAENVVSFRWLVKNGSGTSTANRVPTTNSNGAISASLGGTGIASPTQSGVLLTNGANPMTVITGGSSGNTIIYNGNKFASTPFPGLKKVAAGAAIEKLISINGTQSFAAKYLVTSGSVVAGSVFEINASGTGATSGSSQQLILKLGSATACKTEEFSATSPKFGWSMKIWITVLSVGHSGVYRVDCQNIEGAQENSTGSTLTVDTATGSALQINYAASSTNAYMYLTQFITFFTK